MNKYIKEIFYNRKKYLKPQNLLTIKSINYRGNF